MAVDVSRIPNNNKFDPVREAILQLQTDVQSGVSGVGSINGQDGLITIVESGNITVGTVGTTITIGIDDSTYLTEEVNDLTQSVTWTNVPDANITQSSVTQHQAALSITESQISDLQSYLVASDLDDYLLLTETGEQTIAGDIVISGDLTISGTTTYINTNHLNIGDNIIQLNADIGGSTAPTEDAGFYVNRGSQPDASFLWDEDDDRFSTYSNSLQTASLYIGTNLFINTSRQVLASSTISSTVPYFTFSGDSNTGVGRATNNKVSLIAEGVKSLEASDTGVSITGDLEVGGTFTADGVTFPNDIITSADFSATDNRFKLTLTQSDSDTIEASFDDVVLSNEMETDYVPYVSVAGGNGATYTTNAVLSQSWLKFNSDTLELGTVSGLTVDSKTIKIGKQVGINDQWITEYGAREIVSSISSLSGSATAKIEFTTAGRIQFNDQYTFPATDGTSGQVLTTDGSGDLSWADASGGGSLTLDDVTTNNNSTTNSITIGALNVTGGVSVDANGVGNTVHVWDDSTSGQPGFIVTNTGNQATSTHTLYLKNYNSGISATVFGQSIASKSIVASSDGGEGLLFGTISNKPIYIGTNNTLALTIDASQDATFQGDVTAPTATIGGILLQDAADRSGLLEVNRKGTTGWSGIQINHADKHWSLMGNNSDVGMYDDHNGEWIWLYSENNELGLYYNGSEQARTQNGYFLATNEFRSSVFRGTNTAYHVTPAGTSNLNNITVGRINSTNTSDTPDVIGNIPFIRSHSGDGNDYLSSIDNLGSYIVSKTDGGYGGGTKPSGSHNGVGIISMQTHTGDYYTQLALDTKQNSLWIRSANGASSFGGWNRIYSDGYRPYADNAGTLDGVDSSQFLRSDADDTMSGNLTFSGNSRYIDLSGGTTSSQNALIIGEQNVYGVRFRWDSGSALQFDGYWNSSTTGTENRDLGYIDVNNRIWYLNQRVQANESLRAPIFYDSNDTNYYVNPNDTSRFNKVMTNNSGATPRYDTAFYVLQAQHWYGDTGSQTMYLGESGNPVRLRGTLRVGSNADADSGMKLTVAGSANATSDFRAPIFYDSNNTGYYLHGDGTSRLNIVNANAVGTSVGGVGKVLFPYGAEYNSGSTTGAIKITLPQSWTNTMMTMKITIFDYSINESFEVHCGGYNYAGGGGSWVNTHAKIIANPHLDRNFNVRFGHDGSKCCVIIGETNSAWAYPKVVVTEWVGGHSNETFNNWDNGWDISIVTTLPSNIDQTRSNNQVGRTTDSLQLPYYNGGTMYLRTNSHWESISGIDVIGGAGEFRFSSDTGNLNVRADGWIISQDDMRAPIFYDYSDTNYYIDPNGSNLSIKVAGEICNSNAYQGNLQAGALNIGRTDTNYAGIQSWASDVRFGIMANCLNEWEFGIHDSGSSVESVFLYQNSNGSITMGRDVGWGTTPIIAANSFRAPIFYDSNNTAGYADLASDNKSLAINGGIKLANTNAQSKSGFIGRHGGGGSLNTDAYPSPLYSIGDSYRPSGTGLSNHYGVGYSHTNASFYGLSGQSGWGFYVSSDGDARVQLSGSNGTISCTGDVVAYASDGRLKENVKPIENALDKVMKIRGVSYDWVGNITEEYDFHPTKMHEVGVIAQEVQAVLPEVVTIAPFNSLYSQKTGWTKIQKKMESELGREVTKAEAKTEYEKLPIEEQEAMQENHDFLTVNYERLTALLIEAVKEQQKQIDELKSLINKS